MKKLFLTMVAVMLASLSYAQNTLVATLTHGEDITMFYGVYALRNALNAATSGDVINLSGGAFQAQDITKAVTLRGAGIDDATPTYITSNFIINVPSDDVNRLSMEGIRCTGTITINGSFNSPYFVKSAFFSFDFKSSSAIKNMMFANCLITSTFSLGGASNVNFVNSYVCGFTNLNQNNTAASFINCVVFPLNKGFHTNTICNSQLINCIIFQTLSTSNQNLSLPSSTQATNCVSIGYNKLFDAQAANTGNSEVDFNGLTQVFKNFEGNNFETEQFELSDEAKSTYLGTDGTEVGMHGGVLPYTSTPSYPQITKMNVANKTTADGKLSVEIEVSAAE